MSRPSVLEMWWFSQTSSQVRFRVGPSRIHEVAKGATFTVSVYLHNCIELYKKKIQIQIQQDPFHCFSLFSLYGVVQIRKFNIVSQISEERPLLFVWSYPNLNSLKMLLGNFPQIIPFFL